MKRSTALAILVLLTMFIVAITSCSYKFTATKCDMVVTKKGITVIPLEKPVKVKNDSTYSGYLIRRVKP